MKKLKKFEFVGDVRYLYEQAAIELEEEQHAARWD